MTATRMGRVQLKIMQVLWEKGRANAREITEAMSLDQHIAHSTVQTLLRKLEEKGSIGHDVEDRTFVFFPLVHEEKVAQTATRELVERVFGGSAAGLVAYLVQKERISRKELDEIRKLIDDKSSKRG
jgi:BlaI family penicillinase repressor